jgi:FAD/FMN-containing dehydrogenase
MAQKAYEDYGHLYRKDPAETVMPRDVEDLARTLKKYNDQGRFVTLRNTAHSCNAQTLTPHVQLNLSSITNKKFDRERMTVTSGAGNSWNSVLNAIKFPEFCLPLFPNNPGQRIHIGGTAGVGGVGYYGSKVGGFWNCVRSFRLVTMTGEIIECSRDKHPDYFYYSLGGFGRLGVIAEMTVDVVPSESHVLGMLLLYRDHTDFENDMVRAMNDTEIGFDGVAGQEDIPNNSSLIGGVLTKLDLKILTVIKEVDPEDEFRLNCIIRDIRKKYSRAITLFMKVKDSNLDVSLDPVIFKKKELVYFSPAPQNFFLYLLQRACQILSFGVLPCRFQPQERHGTRHPWNDCIVPYGPYESPDGTKTVYGDFMGKAKHIIAKRGFEKNISKQSIFHGLINVDSFVTFLIRKRKPAEDEFPVALDLPGQREVSMGLAIMPDLPPDELEKLPDLLEMCDELTDLTYEHGGRRYLYGYHKLTPRQLVQHYGEQTIAKWNALKREVDPKQLLNMGVISRELDEF